MGSRIIINNYCFRYKLNLIAVVKRLRNRGVPVYKFGNLYYVFNFTREGGLSALDQALRAKLQENQPVRVAEKLDPSGRPVRGLEKYHRDRATLEFVRSLLARGLSLEQIKELIQKSELIGLAPQGPQEQLLLGKGGTNEK